MLICGVFGEQAGERPGTPTPSALPAEQERQEREQRAQGHGRRQRPTRDDPPAKILIFNKKREMVPEGRLELPRA